MAYLVNTDKFWNLVYASWLSDIRPSKHAKLWQLYTPISKNVLYRICLLYGRYLTRQIQTKPF